MGKRLKKLQLGDRVSYDSLRIALRQYAENFGIAVVIALTLRFFVISAYQVSGADMSPGLRSGDFLLAYKLPYGWPIPFGLGQRLGRRPPQRGEVVIMSHPKESRSFYARRVIAVPGDRVEIRRQRLYLNDTPAHYTRLEVAKSDGRRYSEPVFREQLLENSREITIPDMTTGADIPPQVVPPGHFFVLSDRRDSIEDSRTWGMVPENHLVGRVVRIWMSMEWGSSNQEASWPTVRWERVFQAVD